MCVSYEDSSEFVPRYGQDGHAIGEDGDEKVLEILNDKQLLAESTIKKIFL